MRRSFPAASLGSLQPAAHGRLIVQVLRTEFPFQVLLFSRYDDIVDQRDRPYKRGQQPHAVEPDRDTKLEHGERQIDRVPAEVIRARADDHHGGPSGGHRRTNCPEFRNRVREQRYGNRDEKHSERHGKGIGKEWKWYDEVDQSPGDERNQIYKRGANETEIRNVPGRA
jgi:hypothetical protein